MKAGRRTQLLILVGLVWLSRLPFLLAGHGNDPDAWELANAARHLVTTGEYQASRLPGYPLPELSYGLLVALGFENPFVFNSLCAALSGVAVLFFGLILQKSGTQSWLLPSLTLAFTPVFFIHSTNSMDYMWGLAFVLGATWSLLDQRPLLGGLLLGLAIGSRLTSALLFLPLLLLLLQQHGRAVWRPTLRFSLSAAGIGALLFLPVLQTYGWGFLTSFGNPPPLLWLVYSASVGVWGALGALALAALLLLQLPKISRWKDGVRAAWQKTLMPTALLAIPLYGLAFVLLPHDGAYLLPALPFTLFLLQRWLPRQHFVWLCAALILSSFVLTVERDKIRLAGPIFNDLQERLEKTAFVERYLTEMAQLEQPSLVVAGPWLPQITAMQPIDSNPQVETVFLISAAELEPYLEAGYQLYYLADQRALTQEYHAYDLEALGGRPLVPDEPTGVKW